MAPQRLSQQEEQIMNHPLSRIFIPICNIVFVAALTVAIATSNFDDRTAVDETTIATEMTGKDELTALAVSQTASDRP
jgi:hypothetical protein